MSDFGDLVYTPEKARGEAAAKVESHTPRIQAPERVRANEPFEVEIEIGPHPNTTEHSIRRIEVYLQEENRTYNPILIASVDLTPVYSEPKLTLTLRMGNGGILHAIGYCNLHGLWEARKKIAVEE